MKTSLPLFASLVALLTVACASTPEGAKTAVKPQDLKGTWSSPTCEAAGGTNFIQRHFTLTENTWTLNLDAFGDAQCQTKLFTARVQGPYTLEKDSAAVPGATEGNFGFGELYMTPHLPALAEAFQNAKCGTGTWKVGEEQRTTETGCLFFQPTSACGTDHDLVKVDGEQLFFGQRPADNNMCTPDKRPAALTAKPVVKR
ncbi:hypothetical protein [Hyalangium rubrum]|uniref:APCDD1 domain-containing protein n=1 Tax=Hyalangium rubrum TaxID=3103134 RepID=A0ABU5HGF0_9BACT|nr:hypothetical protein [Hyalangium sp. s54d21]MDY7232237.1 hypothetical protein [Hyalangium sp. s54d21]